MESKTCKYQGISATLRLYNAKQTAKICEVT
uniref:Uncharacterized protein n=1 Tax=Anguilla anguilla TaxID=7936 RepID=A0A0E9QZT1_ANGAN